MPPPPEPAGRRAFSPERDGCRPMSTRLREMSAAVRELETRLREGGGPERVARLHKQGKLTARERVAALCDRGRLFLEIGLLVAHDRYDGQAPAAGVVTGIG